MRSRSIQCSLFLISVPILFSSVMSFPVSAVTRYVNINNSSPLPPYTSWATAAKVIQHALDECNENDRVIVAAGVYATGGAGSTQFSRVSIPRKVSLISLSGPEQTIIVGAGPAGPTAVRGVSMGNYTLLSGFTVSNGHTVANSYGGGISGFGIVSNCIVCCNFSAMGGGGIYRGAVYNSRVYNNHALRSGGGVHLSSIYNSQIYNNLSDDNGGGIYNQYGRTISNCIIYSNVATNNGGGIYNQDATAIDSLIYNNYANWGGGVYIYEDGTLNRCIVQGNSGVVKGSTFSRGGGVYCHSGGEVNNCLIIGNKAERIDAGGYGGGVYLFRDGIVRNSTIVLNSLALDGGGVYVNQAGQVYNSIVYDNHPDNNEFDVTNLLYQFNCSWPLIAGPGNITNAPLFIDPDNGIFQTRTGSPCIDAGSNVLTNDIGDIDGTDRIINTVDIGCYEFVPEHYSSALNYYVSPVGENHYPYTTPAWAAHNVQDAVRAAQAGDTVHVAPGMYSSSYAYIRGLKNRIALTKAVTVMADDPNPSKTVILGEPDCFTGGIGSNAMRCAYLTNGAVLAGITLSGGYTKDTGSSTYEQSGPGAFLDYGGVLSNCISAYNTAFRWGGGVNCNFGGIVTHCSLHDNSAQFGAGARCYFGGMIENCMISANTAWRGGGVQVQNRGSVRNCLITDNQATDLGGGIHCYNGGVFENCTVCDNSAAVRGGGTYCDSGGTNINMILYYNTAPEGPNYYNDDAQAYYMFTCTTPLITGIPGGSGIITSTPDFVHHILNNYRLSSSSACIDAGTNMPWMIGAHDLDNEPRIHDGIVDMGAYEYVPEPGLLLFAVLISAFLACRRSTLNPR